MLAKAIQLIPVLAWALELVLTLGKSWALESELVLMRDKDYLWELELTRMLDLLSLFKLLIVTTLASMIDH
jgi:hypothetical protein